MSAVPGASAALASLVTRLRRIPRVAADYTVRRNEAAQGFGLDTATLAELLRLGLPHGGKPSDPLFARSDLLFIGVRLGTAQGYLGAMRQRRRSLEHFAEGRGNRVRINCVPQLPGAEIVGLGTVVLPGGKTRQTELHHNQSAAEIDVTLRASWPAIPPRVATMLEEVAQIELCQLPTRLRGNTQLAQSIGLADCWTAACVIANRCQELSWPARIAHGLMVGLPFSARHSWAEILVAGTWVPVDPMILTSMRRFAGLDERRWPHSRSIGPMLARFTVARHPVALVSHEGQWLEVTYVTGVAS